MPPKKYSNITAPLRRTTRATARKSVSPSNLSPNSASAKSSTAVDNSPEIRATTKESSPPSTTSRKHKTAPKSSHATAPTASSETSPKSVAPKTNPKDVGEEPHTLPVQSEATPSNMVSEITSQIGVEKTLVVKVSPPPEKPVIEGEKVCLETHVEKTTISPKEELQSVDASDVKSLNVESKITDRVEQTLVGKSSAPPENAVIEAEKTGGAKTKTTVKKTIRIVKKMVRKKIPKKIKKEHRDLLNEVPEMLGSSATNAETPSPYVLGEVQVLNPNFAESVNMEVENPNFIGSVNMEVEKLKPVDSFSMEVETNSNTDDTVVMETENSISGVIVSDAAVDCEANPTFVVSLDVERPSLDVETQKESEVMEVEKPSLDVGKQKESEVLEVEKPSLDVLIQKESEVSEGEKDDGSLIENLSEVPDLEFDEAKKTVSVTETQLKDQNVNPLRDQNHECTSENNLDLESADGKCEEEMKEKVENNDIGGLKVKALLGDGVLSGEMESGDGKCEEEMKEKVENNDIGGLKAEALSGGVLSGEMEALERRRRRKTEIFIGGLDKETKEEDIRKVFEKVGEVVEVRLAMSGKTRKNRGYAFVRYALATDAKNALAKYQKVEICGRQCATSPVEGNDTLFLGNIDKRWKSDDVAKLLQSIGIEKIDHVTVIADPNKIELNRGFAFLELETNKDAQYAYKKLQNKGVFGKNLHIKVAWAEPLIEPDENEMLKVKSVYAEYLPYSWDEEKVKDCFCKFGEIENVVLAKDMPSSRRKDFAFVNYTTREAALVCIEAFNREQIDNQGSKVKVKVSLAKPIPKGQQMKHSRTPPSKELSKEKHKGTQPVIKQHEVRNMRIAASSSYEDIRVDQRSSTTSELVQLLREQASSRPTRPGLGIGSVNLEYSYPSPGRKRPFPLLGDYSHLSDPRGHPRARVEGSYPIAHPSAFTRGVGMTSLPHHHQQIAGYTSESFYRVEDYPNYGQSRDRAPYNGSSGIHRRY